MADDFRPSYVAVADDGTFWRNGDRWIRSGPFERRLLDIAPNMERRWMMLHFLECKDEHCDCRHSKLRAR